MTALARDTVEIVRGARIRIQRIGEGEPMLFLHGATGVMRCRPFFDELAQSHELLVPDHPGFGESDDPGWIRSVRDVAMFYLDMLEMMKLESVHVVGHCIGGWIAAEIAVRDCSRFRGLTLISPAGIRLKGVPVGDPFLWSADESVFNLYMDRRLAEQQLAQIPSSHEQDILIKNQFTFAKLAWQPRLFDPDLEKWLHRVKVPTQIIWGEGDKLIPADYARLWKERLPNAQASLIPQCGHLPQVERMGTVAELMRQFATGSTT